MAQMPSSNVTRPAARAGRCIAMAADGSVARPAHIGNLLMKSQGQAYIQLCILKSSPMRTHARMFRQLWNDLHHKHRRRGAHIMARIGAKAKKCGDRTSRQAENQQLRTLATELA